MRHRRQNGIHMAGTIDNRNDIDIPCRCIFQDRIHVGLRQRIPVWIIVVRFVTSLYGLFHDITAICFAIDRHAHVIK